MMQLISLITAFGLGSVVTTFIQSWLSLKAAHGERSFREKQAAYVGLLEAYHRAAVEGTDEAAKYFAYWQMRCDLVGSVKVRNAIRRVVETNDDRFERNQAHDILKDALREDLGVTK